MNWRNVMIGVAVIAVFVVMYMMMMGGKDAFSKGKLDSFSWDIYWSSELSSGTGNDQYIRAHLESFVASQKGIVDWTIKDMSVNQLDKEFEIVKYRGSANYNITKNIERAANLPMSEIDPYTLNAMYWDTFQMNLKAVFAAAEYALRGRKGVWVPWTADRFGDYNLNKLNSAVRTFRSRGFSSKFGVYNIATGEVLYGHETNYGDLGLYLFLSK